MDIEKIAKAVKLCGSTPKVDQCKQCTYWAGGDMSECIPRMTLDAAITLSTLQAENARLRAEMEQVKRERDAIEQDFRAFTKQWWEEANGFPCRFCKFEHSGGCEQKAKHPDDEKPCVGRWFEWRGPKED